MSLPPTVIDRLRGRSALVLGSTGFVGRWAAMAAAEAGMRPLLVGRDEARLGALAAALPVASDVILSDLATPGAVRELLRNRQPEVIFNLAGYGVYPFEQDEPRLRRINTELVSELVEFQRAQAGLAPAVLVHAGSAFEYGNVGGNLSESGPAEPTSAYGRTKLAATRYLEAQAATGLPIVVARLFTVYGPGEREGRLLNTLIRAAATADDIPLTAGTQRRDFCYVGDVAEGLLRLAAAVNLRPAQEATVNLATGELLSVREFAEHAASVLGIDPARLKFGALAGRAGEMEHDPVSLERLHLRTGWVPATTPAEGVRRTASAAQSLLAL
ncbi:MAG: NAD-dependent epimerase/dehydratase [Pirellulales bacterium]|nr:NAD-dependent epimerase/dehydratase [Pirellulales bacterium]